jgi:hypothetical protein
VVVERSIPSVSLNAKALLCLAFLVLLLVPLDTSYVCLCREQENSILVCFLF